MLRQRAPRIKTGSRFRGRRRGGELADGDADQVPLVGSSTGDHGNAVVTQAADDDAGNADYSNSEWRG